MMNDVFIFAANKKSTAQSKAKIMIADGYDVSVIGPADSVNFRSLIGDPIEGDVWISNAGEIWIVICSNKT